MNIVTKSLTTFIFLLTLPFIIIIGVLAIWRHSKPTYPESYKETVKKAGLENYLQ